MDAEAGDRVLGRCSAFDAAGVRVPQIVLVGTLVGYLVEVNQHQDDEEDD